MHTEKSIILSAAKDLRRYVGRNCFRVVLNDDIGKNQESVSREIDSSEVLRFAQDDRTFGAPNLD
jgi:hypothetical protein